MMADVLSQDEVDALLTAVDVGDVSVEEPVVEQQQTGYVPQEEQKEIAVYDFKRPERVSKDQIRALENIHENFARTFAAAMSGYLRTIIDLKLASVEQLTYSEFIMSLPNPTCFNLLTVAPLDGNMILEINPSIIYPVIDKLLGGGNSDALPPDRELTQIEHRLVRRITNMALEHLGDVWRPIKHINFEVEACESNPSLMQVVPPNEVVVLMVFEMRMGESSGMMNLCIPFPVIDPVIGKISTIQSWFARSKEGVEDAADHLAASVRKAKLQVNAYIGSAEISVRDLVDMEVGMMIKLNTDVNDPVLVSVEGKPKLIGTTGVFRGSKAVLIKDTAPEDSEL